MFEVNVVDDHSPEPEEVAIRTAAVYVAYGADGEVLYVGVTSRSMKRFGEHQAAQIWWHLARRLELHHFPNRQAALAYEGTLIRELDPPFNARIPVEPLVAQQRRNPSPEKMSPSPRLEALRRIAADMAEQEAELRLAAVEAVVAGSFQTEVAEAAGMSREWVRRLVVAANEAVTRPAEPSTAGDGE
jgi:hypothetical protein